MWSIDGSNWDVPCTIEREAEVTASEVSGMLLNKQTIIKIIDLLKYMEMKDLVRLYRR